MTNRKSLKKTINQVCNELATNAVAAALYGPEGKGDSDAQEQIFSVLKLQSHYVSRVSHPEPGMPPKQYYRDLMEKFAAQAGEIADQMLNS